MSSCVVKADEKDKELTSSKIDADYIARMVTFAVEKRLGQKSMTNNS
jgi:hypothetical protein